MRLGVQGQGEFKLRKPQPSALDFRLAFGKNFLMVLSREYGNTLYRDDLFLGFYKDYTPLLSLILY